MMSGYGAAASSLPRIGRAIVGRDTSFFSKDLERASDDLNAAVESTQILIIGGAGSIGSQTLRTLIRFRPRAIHVIDHNENGLAELIRSLRSDRTIETLPEIQLLPFNYGGAPFKLWLRAQTVRYDLVLNFAALKHVRSEKDPYSILAMLETNVAYLDDLSGLLVDCQQQPRRVFSVSTDKAANPSSMMGATKRLMEHALFLPTKPWPRNTELSTARFANVAFSNGSLLQSWENRVTACQPLAVPDGARRYFVTLSESGELCTLAGVLGVDRTISVPALDPGEDLVSLSDAAIAFLEGFGYEAYFTTDVVEAQTRIDELQSNSLWPVLLTPLDTGGEKPYEEFVAANETALPSAFDSIRQVGYLQPDDPGAYREMVKQVRDVLAGRSTRAISTDELRALIATVEPEFATSHRWSAKSLDQRM